MQWDINKLSPIFDTGQKSMLFFDAKQSPIENSWLASGNSSHTLIIWDRNTRYMQVELHHGCAVLTGPLQFRKNY